MVSTPPDRRADGVGDHEAHQLYARDFGEMRDEHEGSDELPGRAAQPTAEQAGPLEMVVSVLRITPHAVDRMLSTDECPQRTHPGPLNSRSSVRPAAV